MKKGLIIGLCIVGYVCLVLFLIIPHLANMDVTYEGQEVFLTQQEFEDFKGGFKMLVYEDGLRLESFDVLASEPPIIVNFEVTVPYDYYMPYGGSVDRANNIFGAFFLSIVLGMLLVFLPIAVLD